MALFFRDDDLTKAILALSIALRDLTEQRDREFKWLRSHFELATKQDLKEMEQKILMTQRELSEALDKLTEQTGKIAKEQSDRFDALSAEIKRLEDLINAGEVTTEVSDALTRTKAALQTLDDAIPDPPTP